MNTHMKLPNSPPGFGNVPSESSQMVRDGTRELSPVDRAGKVDGASQNGRPPDFPVSTHVVKIDDGGAHGTVG